MKKNLRCLLESAVLEPCNYCCFYCDNKLFCASACPEVVDKHLSEREIAKQCEFVYEEK